MFPKIEITRSFNAPRELVFKAFTESEHLQNWRGPKGWAFDISKFELRQEGVFHYSQTSPDGNVMWVKFVYHEVNAPDKLVYTSFFSDEMGNIVLAPFNDNLPLETFNTFTFTEHGGKTILTVIGAPVSPTEEETVQEGFSGTFVQLADYLSTISYD
ncbi:SRPBCC domain-containing protein [Peribacillus frigoritolerans]|uniref:SRPBCC domain-containing protein n=1 Tax=Peribacillus frigoritolerans TaxID=450367 RepID=UPI002E1E3815|nr:SRPBCC domain-containing protein [Peribacillus frigoritolerans]